MSVVFMGIFIASVLVLTVIVLRIRSKIRQISQEFLGTPDIVEGLKELEINESTTPKSLNAMTSLYLPRIKKDFPEFQYDEMKVRAQNVLTSFLLSLDTKNPGGLSEGSPELKAKLSNRIDVLDGEGCREEYKTFNLHRTEISDYRKADGRCIITFQISCQYYYAKVDENGSVIAGNRDMLTQARYNVDVIYIQDRDKITNEYDFAIGTNCPNCGAPLKGLGDKICQYCGTPLREINIYAWTFSNVEKSA